MLSTDPTTPTIRPSHALRWVLGVGLVFVVVVGMALQVARRRADERWERVLEHLYKYDLASSDVMEDGCIPLDAGHLVQDPRSILSRGGNVLRAWRQSRWDCLAATIVMRQERHFLGSHIEVELSESYPEYGEAMRAILAPVDVELVVEP